MMDLEDLKFEIDKSLTEEANKELDQWWERKRYAEFWANVKPLDENWKVTIDIE